MKKELLKSCFILIKYLIKQKDLNINHFIMFNMLYQINIRVKKIYWSEIIKKKKMMNNRKIFLKINFILEKGK